MTELETIDLYGNVYLEIKEFKAYKDVRLETLSTLLQKAVIFGYTR